jgi:hypothetical protein
MAAWCAGVLAWIQILRSAVAALTPERRRQELGGEFARSRRFARLGEPGAEGRMASSRAASGSSTRSRAICAAPRPHGCS